MSRTTERARRVAERVTDPELPMLTLVDLGVLRDVDVVGDSHVVVDITPTYSGCPAMATMRDDLVRELECDGYDPYEKLLSLDPALKTGRNTTR
jgi:ring-1,2-phenylacetyl-CoA epoxidase subunit PaaD